MYFDVQILLQKDISFFLLLLSLYTFSNQFTVIIMKKLVLAIVLLLSAGVSSAYVQQVFGLIDLDEYLFLIFL